MDLVKEQQRLRHDDLIQELMSLIIRNEWFSAFLEVNSEQGDIILGSALVPLIKVPLLLEKSDWMIDPFFLEPNIWSCYENGIESGLYNPLGNDLGIEPLVLVRSFHGLRPKFLEIFQEFRLYHNLYPLSDKEFVVFEENGDHSVAVKLNKDSVEIRKDLLLNYCAAKQMALALFIDSTRFGKMKLSDLGLKESTENKRGQTYVYEFLLREDDFSIKNRHIISRLIGKKLYFLALFRKIKPRKHLRKSFKVSLSVLTKKETCLSIPVILAN